MNIFGLETQGLKVAEKSLNFLSRSALVTAANIANSETPGYRAKTIEFKDAMAKALQSGGSTSAKAGVMARTNPRHLPATDFNKIQPVTTEITAGASLNGNTVSLDTEITRLNENNIKYSVFTTIAAKEFQKLKLAIRDNR